MTDITRLQEALLYASPRQIAEDLRYIGKAEAVAAELARPGIVAGDLAAAQAEVQRLTGLLNTPELHDFSKAVALEAAHQRERWGNEHDAGKEPPDWFWLVGYLAGKALRAHLDGNVEKALHHTISTAAALANWHAAITGEHTGMRPGIDGEAALGVAAGEG